MTLASEAQTTLSPLEYADDLLSRRGQYGPLVRTISPLQWTISDLTTGRTSTILGPQQDLVDMEIAARPSSTWRDNYALRSEGALHAVTLLSCENATWEQAAIWEYKHPEGLFVVVDFTNALAGHSELDPPWLTLEERAVLSMLRLNSRPVVAKRLEEILTEMAEDPLECNINIVSLWALVMMLARQHAFADPVIGPDNQGDMYAQWLIERNGIIAFGFPEGDDVLFVAQQDGGPCNDGLDISDRGLEQDIIDKYGYLVPLRSPKAVRFPS